MNKDFLREVLRGDKNLLKLKDIKPIYVPLYAELSVAKMLEKFKDDRQLMMYLPKITAKGKT